MLIAWIPPCFGAPKPILWQEYLKKVTKLLRFTHSDTYITGPFDFEVINGKEQRDRFPQDISNSFHVGSLVY